MAPALYLLLGGFMNGWCAFRPRHGGRLVADHLLQIAFFVVSLSAFAQSGDGFSQSDRDMLRDVRSIAAGNSTKLTTIQQVVQEMSPVVDQIETDVSSINDALAGLNSSQLYFNNVQWNMMNMLDNWNLTGLPGTEDLPLIQLNTYNAATHLSYIRSDVSDILADTASIDGHLVNIDRETNEASDTLLEIKTILTQFFYSQTNAAANVITYRMLTNALNQISVGSSYVDLGMLTNLYLSTVVPYDIYARGNITAFPTLEAWIRSYQDTPPPLGARYIDYLSRSSFGLQMALLDSALVSRATLSTNPWARSREFWFGDNSSGSFRYTIFDAYNTLGLGALTNQANTLIGQGVYVTNSLAIIVSNLVASLSVAEKTRDALYYPEDSETIYEATNHYSIPEWEPTYQTGIAGNTNHYYYFQQADSFTHSLIGNYTSLLGRVIGGIQPQHRDWDAKITWSGWPSMQGQYGGWDLDVRLPDTSDVVDFAKYVKFLSRLVCFVLDLCIVLLGATRIHKTVMGGKLPFEQ